MPFMWHLRVLEIHAVLYSGIMGALDTMSVLIRSLLLSLTSPTPLEHIEFNIVFKGYRDYFDYDWFRDTLRDADLWSHLNSIITHPTGSRLQRVDINFEYTFRYNDNVVEPDNAKISELVLDALPLLHEKGILFVKAN